MLLIIYTLLHKLNNFLVEMGQSKSTFKNGSRASLSLIDFRGGSDLLPDLEMPLSLEADGSKTLPLVAFSFEIIYGPKISFKC